MMKNISRLLSLVLCAALVFGMLPAVTAYADTEEETVPTQATEAPGTDPTEKPTEAPTEAPTQAPTEKPTEAPTETPTEAPTETPTEAPTEAPTEETIEDTLFAAAFSAENLLAVEAIEPGENKTLTLGPGGSVDFSFTPAVSGTYVFHMHNGEPRWDGETYYAEEFTMSVVGAASDWVTNGTYYGRRFTAEAGTAYTLRVTNDWTTVPISITGTVRLEECKAPDSITIERNYGSGSAVSLGYGDLRLYAAWPSETAYASNINWTSSDESVLKLTYSYEGSAEFTPVSKGTVTVTVTAEGGLIASRDFEVVEPQLSINYNNGTTHSYIGTQSDCWMEVMFTPETDYSGSCQWESSDPSVLQLQESNYLSAVFVPVQEGAVTVTATLGNGMSVSRDFIVKDNSQYRNYNVLSKELKDALSVRVDADMDLFQYAAVYRPENMEGTWGRINPESYSVTQDGTFVLHKEYLDTLLDGDYVLDLGFFDGFCEVPFRLDYASATVTPDREYITLEVGSSETLTAAVTPEWWADDLVWSAEDPEIISVTPEGKVTAIAPGTAYAVATVAHNGYTVSGRCRVDVTENEPRQTLDRVQLGADNLTTELYSTNYTVFDVVLQLKQNLPTTARFAMRRAAPADNGVAIESARFADENTARVFSLRVKDDRTLWVVPNEEILQEAVYNAKAVASRYTSQVIVTVNGVDYTAEGTMTLTVKKTLPKLKADSVTINPFFTEQTYPVHITGATVTGMEPTSLPSWLSITEDGVLKLLDASPKSGSAKVNLNVSADGWAVPLPVSVPVRLSYKAPGLKLSASSVTIPYYSKPDDYGAISTSVRVQLQCKNKADTLEDLGVSQIEAPEGWYVSSLYDDGDFFFAAQYGDIIPQPGKVTLKVHFHGTDGVVELPLTVKTKATSYVIRTWAPSNLRLSSVATDGFGVSWYAEREDPDSDNCNLFWRVRDKQGVDVSDKFADASYSGSVGYFRLRTTEKTEPGTYELLLDIHDAAGNCKTDKPAVIKFTVLGAKALPSMTIKANNAMDLAFPNASVSFEISPNSFKNYLGYQFMIEDPTFTDAKGNPADDLFDYNRYGPEILPKEDAVVAPGTYTAHWTVHLSGYDRPIETTTKFTVKNTSVRVKLSKTSMTLNGKISDYDFAQLTCLTKGYDLTAPIIQVMDAKGKVSAADRLHVSCSYGYLNVSTLSKTEPGATYKILVRARECDAPVTLTVKILDLKNSTVSATLKAKGAIDPIRDNTSALITPTYKNCADFQYLDQEVKIIRAADGADVTSDFTITRNDYTGVYTVAKVPGVQLDTTDKYLFQIVFPDGIGTTSSMVLPVKSASARVTAGTAVLYKNDKNCRANLAFGIADKNLNRISKVRIKDAKMEALYEIHDYGNGQFAIGFKDGVVAPGVKTGNVALEIFFDGNDSIKPNASVNIKVQIS